MGFDAGFDVVAVDALAAAVSPGWTMAIWSLALFVTVELLVGQVVEPLLYGRSTGLSPFSVVVAAIFWSWIWGPIGLILSTPLTVCVATPLAASGASRIPHTATPAPTWMVRVCSATAASVANRFERRSGLSVTQQRVKPSRSPCCAPHRWPARSDRCGRIPASPPKDLGLDLVSQGPHHKPPPRRK